jgi:hypothetical protein
MCANPLICLRTYWSPPGAGRTFLRLQKSSVCSHFPGRIVTAQNVTKRENDASTRGKSANLFTHCPKDRAVRKAATETVACVTSLTARQPPSRHPCARS